MSEVNTILPTPSFQEHSFKFWKISGFQETRVEKNNKKTQLLWCQHIIHYNFYNFIKNSDLAYDFFPPVCQTKCFCISG